MLSQEQNELLTRVGPGTPMGELLRRYWHPIGGESEFEQRATRPVRLMGEDLSRLAEAQREVESATRRRRGTERSPTPA